MFTELERENLAKQFLPLVKKLTNQYFPTSGLDYDEVEGFAWEGLVLAMNKYDSNRSKMTFQQYAGYSIRNSIFNGISTSSRTISVSYYMQKKMRENGQDVPSTRSIDRMVAQYEMSEDHMSELADDCDFEKPLASLGVEEISVFNPWSYLMDELKKNFEPEWIDMFCSLYGLDGHEVLKGKEIADKYNVSSALVTIRKNKIIDFIKTKPELLDILRELL